MTRVVTKIGDVFEVLLERGVKKYFQYIGNDHTQLNSDVIRAFKTPYLIDTEPDLSLVIKDEVSFYAHCVVKWGVKMNLWKKVGNVKEVGTANVYFRGSSDSGRKIGEEPIKVSERWYVWKINDDRFTPVGKLPDKYQNAEIGMVISPIDIVHRLQTGEYNFWYPGY